MGAVSGHWYLIYRYNWVNGVLVRERYPVDGAFASHADAAIEISADRNDYGTATLNAVFCTAIAERLLAVDLDSRHTETWWSRSEFVEWMKCQAAIED